MKSINQKYTSDAKHQSQPQNGKAIVLVGMMGVGKSTIGKRLALRLNIPFVDVDDEIMLSANMDISDIFEKHGEQHFRNGERKVIERLLDGTEKVIATGGGAFIQDDTRAIIMQHARTIWLHANLDILVNRVSRRNTRPLLHNRDPKEVIAELSKIRDPIYAMAQYHIRTDDNPHEQTASKIIEALSQ